MGPNYATGNDRSVGIATSKKIEMNLTNVARSSITGMKKDYEAFLRQNNIFTE